MTGWNVALVNNLDTVLERTITVDMALLRAEQLSRPGTTPVAVWNTGADGKRVVRAIAWDGGRARWVKRCKCVFIVPWAWDERARPDCVACRGSGYIAETAGGGA